MRYPGVCEYNVPPAETRNGGQYPRRRRLWYSSHDLILSATTSRLCTLSLYSFSLRLLAFR
jgi:hypothetical protein